jgi:hypothetical protein
MIAINEPIKLNPRTKLIEDLFREAPEQKRCPHIRRDESSEPYCGKNLLEGQKISETRYMVCGTESLQLWCLDKERAPICIYYKGEPLD